MKTLIPEEVIACYSYTFWFKDASTHIKIIDEADIARESSFLDLEGRAHEVKLGRCICIGPLGERWTCSTESLERDRYPVSEPDEQGYRAYKMKHPQAVRCFDLPFPFTLLHKGQWRCEEQSGGIITWNGERGENLDMRVIGRSVFTATYQPDRLSFDHHFESLKAALAQEQSVWRSNTLEELRDHQHRRDTMNNSWQAIQAILQPIQQARKQLPTLPDQREIRWAQSMLLLPNRAFLEIDTTGLEPDDDLVRFTLTDGQGEIIEDFLIKPITRVLTPQVSAINGVRLSYLLRDGLELPIAWERIKKAVAGRYVLSYGLDWDLKVLSQVAARQKLEPITMIADDLQRHCTHYYQYTYPQKLTELCKQMGHPLPPPPGQTALDRARGQVAVLASIATGVTDVRPATTQATTMEVDLSADDDEEHPF